MDDTKHAKHINHVVNAPAGFLFIAPMMNGSWPDDEWIGLGVAEECGIEYGCSSDDRPFMNMKEWMKPITFTFRADQLSPYGWHILTRTKHPRVSALRRAYRAKQGRR